MNAANDRRAAPLLAETARLHQNIDMVPPEALLRVAGELVGLALARGGEAAVDVWLNVQCGRWREWQESMERPTVPDAEAEGA